MQYQERLRKIGFIEVLLLSWFILIYFLQMLHSNQNLNEILIACLVIGIGSLVMLKTTRGDFNITNSSLLVLVYFIFLAFIISFTSLFSINPTNSIIRGIYSVVMCLVAFFIFKDINKKYLLNFSWRNFLAKTFLLNMLIIIIGQVLIPEWKLGIGGVRLTGGTNPNFVSFFALFIIFISHLNGLLNEKWLKIDKLNWVLANIILLWSMSRSGYLGYGVFYLFYFGWYFIKGYLTFLLRGKLQKKLVSNTFLIMCFGLILLFLIRFTAKTNFYNYTILRLTGESGLTSRTMAWEVLLEHFRQNPLFGGIGWWNASDILPNVEGMGGSAHSLYVRLLSEVGIVGMVVILALPAFVVVGLIANSYLENDLQKEKVKMLTCSFLLGTFALQFFEDKFLTGLFSMGNNIIIWVLALGFILLNKNIRIRQ